MKTVTLLSAVLVLLLSACGSPADIHEISIDQQIENLKTPADRRAFLEKIAEDDQRVRGPEGSELMLKYGKDSEEHMAYVRAQWRQDSINLVKIDKYLARFGHPSKKELGTNAATTPWLVIHHTGDTGVRNWYFPILYRAYLNGDIDDGAFTMYLGRTYEFTFGSRLQLENPYTVEAEIDQLVEALGLEEERAKVEQSVNR